MKITPDTNVLLRPLLRDNPAQARMAEETLAVATTVAVTTPSLCEYTWVLRQGYKKSAGDVAAAIRTLMNISTVCIDRPAIEAGLAALEAGGDFADGVIAFEGRRLGGDVFVSFDAKAVRKVAESGGDARLLEA